MGVCLSLEAVSKSLPVLVSPAYTGAAEALVVS